MDNLARTANTMACDNAGASRPRVVQVVLCHGDAGGREIHMIIIHAQGEGETTCSGLGLGQVLTLGNPSEDLAVFLFPTATKIYFSLR